MLTSKKVEIFEAENGKQGIEIAEAEKPDLILMDISMPVMDGIEAVILIKNNPLLSKIPVIAITAEDTKSLIYLPFDGHLKKPIVIPELIGILKKYLKT
jgi:CheY-like chemotaxis protein